MDTLFTTSPDGTRIAYDCCGDGPAILLIHGGGGSRQEWHEAGYVDRLREKFTVITIDLRGHGQSDLPTDTTAYTTDKMGQDILTVADACDVHSFILWGMSFGGKVSRYLAVRSDRVTKLILIGAQLGLGVSGQLRQEVFDFMEHWPAILDAKREGTLEIGALSEADQDMLRDFNVPVILAWGQAMLDWPVIEPADFRCPTLWLAGSDDQHAMDSIKQYEEALVGSKVQVRVVEGLDHSQSFDQIDTVFPIFIAFCK